MRHKTIAALLAICLYSPMPAQGADWSNGTFACTVNIESQTAWYLPWQWGRWKKFFLTYNLAESPDYRTAPYACYYFGNELSLLENTYSCAYIGGYNHFRDKQTFFKIELRPGVSKSDACQTVFNQLNLYYEKH